jgi:nuclear transport factor 2 (NTF2) superfamily protein
MEKPRKKSPETRTRIVHGAGRGFRAHGFGGAGVDALAQEAGVTSGAFYGHFGSKSEVFREALVVGLEDLRAGIESFRESAGKNWRERFIDFYLGERRTGDLEESCALQSLSVDAAREGEDSRASYEAEWLRVRDAAAAGFPQKSEEARRDNATALLALLSGGVSIARAVRRPEVSDAIARSIRQAAVVIGGAKARPASADEAAFEAREARVAVSEAFAPPPSGARPPLPPFTAETAAEKARLAEDAWNSRDPARVALAYSDDSHWRNRAEFLQGRDAIREFLARKWARELDYRLIKEVWAFTGNRIAVRFAYEWHDDSGQWYRSHGNEQWEFDDAGLMTRREASINDRPIAEKDRLFHWPLGARPVDHPGLSQLGL